MKFNIEEQIVDININIVNRSVLLRTTIDTNIIVDKDSKGNPYVEIATLEDIGILVKYCNNGIIHPNIIDAFDRLIFEPRILTKDRLKLYWLDRICENKDQEILMQYVPIVGKQIELASILKPVRKYMHYGILLEDLTIPTTYDLIPMYNDGPKDKVSALYGDPKDHHNVLDDICVSTYETLKKYRSKYKYLLVISEHPMLYSINHYINTRVNILR